MCVCVKSDDGLRKKDKLANKRYWGKEKEKWIIEEVVLWVMGSLSNFFFFFNSLGVFSEIVIQKEIEREKWNELWCRWRRREGKKEIKNWVELFSYRQQSRSLFKEKIRGRWHRPCWLSLLLRWIIAFFAFFNFGLITMGYLTFQFVSSRSLFLFKILNDQPINVIFIFWPSQIFF